ncbi:MAG: SirB2 family protein [Chromatiales bacterium]|jgi:uncharacterized membrane protein SirB2
MNSYLLLKSIHLLTIGLSLTGFLLRAWWRFTTPERLQQRFVRIAPHINDSLLLLSGIGLTLVIQQYPVTHHWLTIKLLLLLLYIAAGTVVLKTRFGRKQSLLAFLVAIAAFASMLLVALNHHDI